MVFEFKVLSIFSKDYLLLGSAEFHLAILFDQILDNLFGDPGGGRVHVVARPLGQVTRTGEVRQRSRWQLRWKGATWSQPGTCNQVTGYRWQVTAGELRFLS